VTERELRQPARVGLVRGDVRVPGRDAPVRGREAGCEAGRNNWPVRSECDVARPYKRRHTHPVERRAKREPSRYWNGEGHGRCQRSGSGHRGTLRRSGLGTVRWLFSEMGRSSSAPPTTGGGKRCLPITGDPGKWHGGREEVGWGRSSRRRRGTAQPRQMRRTPTSSMQACGAKGVGQ